MVGASAGGRVIVRALCLLAVLGGLLFACASASAQAPPAISVSGAQLISGLQPITLRGVNRGAYTDCDFGVYDHFNRTGDAYADGPVDETGIEAMASWGINVVRVPVSESCWLGLAGQPSAATGATAAQYRQAVKDYVERLGDNGLYVILSLYSTSPSDADASGPIDSLPDAAHAPAFWQSMTATFGGDDWVMFDLLNEAGLSQYDSNWTESQIWTCWLDGTQAVTTPACPDVPSQVPGAAPYAAAGMQTLIDSVRASDQATPLIIGSPDYDFPDSLMDWQTFRPSGSGLVYDVHFYDFSQFGIDAGDDADPNAEAQAVLGVNAFINDTVVPMARTAPVMIGELGQMDCDDANGKAPFVSGVLASLSKLAEEGGPDLSVLGWTWDADNDHGSALTAGMEQCPAGRTSGGPNLIRDYDGTPTTMGQAFKTWLLAEDPAPVDTAPPGVADSHAPAWVAGDTVTAMQGWWSNAPTGYENQWLDCSEAGGCTPIPGATGATHTLTAAEAGDTVEVMTQGVNGAGAGQAVTAATGTVLAPIPVNSSAPAVTGSRAIGGTVTCDPGTWSPSGSAFTYTWRAGTTVQADAGSTITVGTQYDGETLTCSVAATDPAGTSAPVPAANGLAIPAQATLPGPAGATPAKQAIAGDPAVTSAVVTLSCAKRAKAKCRYRLALTDGKRTIGTATVVVKPGHRAKAVVRLSRAGRTLLARHHTLRARLTVTEGTGRRPKVALRRSVHLRSA